MKNFFLKKKELPLEKEWSFDETWHINFKYIFLHNFYI